MEKKNQTMEQSASINLSTPIRCIVKLGGAAITCKNELETIHDENLKEVSLQLRESMNVQSPSGKILGMDWSKGAGESEISCSINDFSAVPAMDSSSFIVVHGAGSFGHFQASKSGVHKGGLNKPLVKAGFVATRISVTKLNHEIVRALAREGIPSVGVSPFSCGWSTNMRNIASADLSAMTNAIDSGFVPVTHGDAVLDDELGCTILSGDVIIRHLAAHFKPEFVVFMTDVLGVYDRPPLDSTAVLLREIEVHEDGSWSVVKPTLENISKDDSFSIQNNNFKIPSSLVIIAVKTDVAAHDTTGGMETKILEAAMIARLGIDVYIVKAGTNHSLRALRGELRGNVPEDWLGTVIRFSK
ncbi:hypothetical protein F8388_022845 [Cannabis sativa]|uniref:Isopentenyl phosphate kinase n=1 Tax=Cannabis sativa TaxID=3483 RepID=A0A7J6FBZ5_CANSA|nr:hypothetical protein F8388_022845 [Cannabis sativa]